MYLFFAATVQKTRQASLPRVSVSIQAVSTCEGGVLWTTNRTVQHVFEYRHRVGGDGEASRLARRAREKTAADAKAEEPARVRVSPMEGARQDGPGDSKGASGRGHDDRDD